MALMFEIQCFIKNFSYTEGGTKKPCFSTEKQGFFI